MSFGYNSGRFVKCRLATILDGSLNVVSLRRVDRKYHSSFEHLGNVVQVLNAFWSAECVLNN